LHISKICSTFAIENGKEGIMEEKKYYYTYERLHKELMIELSKDYETYSKATELFLLCTRYLHCERIGNYNEVEWNRLGISKKSIPALYSMVGDWWETIRVLVYWRDHANRIINESSSDDIIQFERACCKEIDKLRFEWMKDEIFFSKFPHPNTYQIINGLDNPKLNSADLLTWGIGIKQLADFLPTHSEDDEHSPFHTSIILDVALEGVWLVYHWSKDHIRVCDLKPVLVGAVFERTNRIISSDGIIMSKILFAISVLLETECYKSFRNEDYIQAYHDLSIELMNYTRSVHELFDEWTKPLGTAIKALSHFKESDFYQEFIETPIVEMPTLTEATNENPNTSIFRSDVDAQLCKEKLLDILNHNTCKAEVYRELKDLHDKNLYFNIGTKYAPLARVLNTWIPLTIHKDDKKWIFRGDDFSKTRYS